MVRKNTQSQLATDSGGGSTLGEVNHLIETQIQAGLDLGKVRDPSVLAICEIRKTYHGLKMTGERPSYLDAQGHYHPTEPILVQQFRTVYVLRHMEAFPLGTPYELMSQRTGEIFDVLSAERPGMRITMHIDYTGVGVGVYELVQKALKARPGAAQQVLLRPITLTGGTVAYRPGATSCSKFSLVANMVARMAAHVPELLIPSDLEHLTATLHELRNYQEHLRQESGNASYDGRPGVHDDRVISLGLALLPPIGGVTYSNRIF